MLLSDGILILKGFTTYSRNIWNIFYQFSKEFPKSFNSIDAKLKFYLCTVFWNGPYYFVLKVECSSASHLDFVISHAPQQAKTRKQTTVKIVSVEMRQNRNFARMDFYNLFKLWHFLPIYFVMYKTKASLYRSFTVKRCTLTHIWIV